MSNPRDLVLAQLGELLWLERTLAFEALPKLIEEVRDEELRSVLAEHLEQTRFHAARVEAAFRAAGAEPVGARSAALAGLLDQQASHDVKEPGLRDLQTAWGAARTEQLELGVYDTLLGLLPDEGLSQNRDEERAALDSLGRISHRLAALVSE